jgi:DNA-binding transcriptional MerR regulator
MAADGALRIGELSRRAGVSPELLRAWERRYGLLRPTRSAGGLRLYSTEDVARVERMRQLLAQGYAAAQAAELALGDSPVETADDGELLATALAELSAALDDYDESGAQAVIDRLLAVVTVETLLSKVVLPYLHELGERWQRGEATVALEHFASSVLRGRLLGLARGWGQGLGPVAVLACLPGERHDLGLISFGLALRARGWRIVYLGPDTPIETVIEMSDRTRPGIVVLSAVSSSLLQPVRGQVRRLARDHRVALGGPSADEVDTRRGDLLMLKGDLIQSASQVTDHAAARTAPG